MWIDEERDQAQDLSLRAVILEGLGITSSAYLFREIVELCDRKVMLMQQIDECREFMENIRAASQASVLGDIK